jgi:hypothetical protein
VSLYWFGQLGWSSAHVLYEGMQVYRQFAAAPAADESAGWDAGESADGSAEWGGDGAGWEAPAMPPAAASIFAADMSVRSIVDPAGTYASWTEHDRGGHFPALEVPELLVDDMRAFFGGLR